MEQLIPHPVWRRLSTLRLDDVHGAVGGEEIGPAVVVVIDPVGAEPRERRGEPGQPRARARILEVAAPIVHVQHGRLADDVGDEQIFVAVEIEVARRDAHAALGIARRAQRRSRDEPFVDERPVAAVDPELVRPAVVRHVEIEPAVAVVVAGHDAEPRAVRPGNPRALGDIDEMAAAIVTKQTVGHRPVRARAAIVAGADRIAALPVGAGCEVHVAGDEEIEIAVAVVVEEGGTGAPQRVADARLPRHVAERAVAVVVEQRRRAECRDEEVQVAVVVVVADRRAHAVAAHRDAGLLRDIGEAKRARPVGRHREIVAKEAAGGRRASAGIDRAALDEEDVEVAVVVEVEQRDAGAHHFRQIVLPGRAVDVREHQTGRGGRFDEERVGCRGRRPSTASRREQREQREGRRRHRARGEPFDSSFDKLRTSVSMRTSQPTAAHFNRARSRSIAAASSCWPCSSASCFASVAHLMPSALWPALTCAVASANRYRGTSASRG